MMIKREAAIPTILDIEASGFGPGSYPIEIGLVLASGEEHAWLIRPEPDWTHWQTQAQAVHGISRDQLLAEGEPVAVVAGYLNQLLAGTTVFTDGWGVDSSWLSLLFACAQRLQRFRLDSIYTLLNEDQLERWLALREERLQALGSVAHRAGIDARLTRQVYESVLSD